MFIQVKKLNKSVIWTIERPDRLNAIGPTIAKELTKRLTEIKKSDIHSLILTAKPRESSGVWIAGGDLKELGTLTRPQANSFGKTMRSFCENLVKLPVPTICLLDGRAIGGGAEIALACDIRLATTRSTLDFRQIKVGLTTGFGGTQRLIQLVGLSLATKIILLSENVSAKDALQQNILHQIFDNEPAMMNATNIMVTHFAEIPRPLLAAQKRLLYAGHKANQLENIIFGKLWRNDRHAKTLKHYE